MMYSEPRIQPFQLASASGAIAVASIKLTGAPKTAPDKRYYVSVPDSIVRILTTRLGSRVMRPDFGSDLHLLRDREFNASWRVQATRFIFEAISKFEPRVVLNQLRFNSNTSTGKHSLVIMLDPSPLRGA